MRGGRQETKPGVCNSSLHRCVPSPLCDLSGNINSRLQLSSTAASKTHSPPCRLVLSSGCTTVCTATAPA